MEQQLAEETVGTAQQLVGFGEAIQAIREGRMAQRMVWNSKETFVFMQVPSQVNLEIVPKMTSLPKSVKKEFVRRYDRENSHLDEIDPFLFNSIRYKNQLVIVYPDNTICGWVASSSDILERDWLILD